MKRLLAILFLKCPHCLQGAIFSSLWQMNPTCAICGVRFERESGFFLMAIYFAYALDMLIIAPYLVWGMIHKQPIWLILLVIGVALLLLSPFTLRYTRALWLHVDELFDPRRGKE